MATKTVGLTLNINELTGDKTSTAWVSGKTVYGHTVTASTKVIQEAYAPSYIYSLDAKPDTPTLVIEPSFYGTDYENIKFTATSTDPNAYWVITSNSSYISIASSTSGTPSGVESIVRISYRNTSSNKQTHQVISFALYDGNGVRQKYDEVWVEIPGKPRIITINFTPNTQMSQQAQKIYSTSTVDWVPYEYGNSTHYHLDSIGIYDESGSKYLVSVPVIIYGNSDDGNRHVTTQDIAWGHIERPNTGNGRTSVTFYLYDSSEHTIYLGIGDASFPDTLIENISIPSYVTIKSGNDDKTIEWRTDNVYIDLYDSVYP